MDISIDNFFDELIVEAVNKPLTLSGPANTGKSMDNDRRIIRIYHQGNAAFYDGNKEEDCPFYGGKEMSAWLMGWHDGEDDVLSDSNEILEKLG